MKCFIIYVILTAFSTIKGQQQSCKTVSGGQGQCTSIYRCKPLLELIENPKKTAQDMEFVKRSHCGFDGAVPAVCCSAEKEPDLLPKPRCYTPDGKAGQCVSLHSCPQLENLLKPPVPAEHYLFLERSKCLGSEKHSVCCGPVPSLKDVPKSKCTDTVTAFPPDPRTGCCGIDAKFDTKIIGGTATTIDQYPWLVLIEYKKDNVLRTFCGGALISGRYVLTAGHCVTGEILSFSSPKNIRLGEYDTSQDGPDRVVTGGTEDWTDGLTIVPIERSIPHPQYNPLHPQEKHDIALIRMKEMAPFTEFIRPICIPTTDVTLSTKPFNLTVAGWGATSAFNRSSPTKQHVELPFVPQEKCQREYRSFRRNLDLWKGQLCAGGVKDKDSCKGDSGGPLMFESNRTYVAIGIVSFGPRECGKENVPGVYTHVYQYSAWIRSNIEP